MEVSARIHSNATNLNIKRLINFLVWKQRSLVLLSNLDNLNNLDNFDKLDNLHNPDNFDILNNFDNLINLNKSSKIK
jgi:hypothetical protein